MKIAQIQKEKKRMKRSSLHSNSGVVNHKGFEKSRVFAGGYGSAVWADTLPPWHPLISHGGRPHLSTTNKRQTVGATCQRAFNCLFLSLFLLPLLCLSIVTSALSFVSVFVSLTCFPFISHFFSFVYNVSFFIFIFYLPISLFT